MSIDLYPQKTVLRFKGLRTGMFGYFKHKSFDTLILGLINDDGYLIGRVISDGITQKDIDNENRHFGAPFSVGYSYNNWDVHEMEYVGRLRHYATLMGALDYLENADDETISNYFRTKELLLDMKKM